MTADPIKLSCVDGYPLSAKIFRAEAARGLVVIAPALGVPQRFYASFASYFSERGFTTLTFDYRGSGESVTGAQRGSDMRMADWGRLDIDAALSWAQRERPSGKWARWARTRDYMFDKAHRIDTTRYARLKLQLLSWCIADDSYATPEAVNALLSHYAGARVERRIVSKPAQGAIGHFGFFRERQKDSLWRETADWLEKYG